MRPRPDRTRRSHRPRRARRLSLGRARAWSSGVCQNSKFSCVLLSTRRSCLDGDTRFPSHQVSSVRRPSRHSFSLRDDPAHNHHHSLPNLSGSLPSSHSRSTPSVPIGVTAPCDGRTDLPFMVYSASSSHSSVTCPSMFSFLFSCCGLRRPHRDTPVIPHERTPLIPATEDTPTQVFTYAFRTLLIPPPDPSPASWITNY
ncbi:hypothetical protein F5I97DRAFT_1856532 [Phlebopus sp. FC_14]|nr:hypothetical protein F5I97DRAFT_1856532 [Phlebopus sp. FC_14]